VQKGLSGSVNTNGQFLDTYYSPIRDPACVVHLDQKYRLTTANLITIHEIHYWRFDTSGIWRQ